jgi:hypothetical protein
VLLVDWRAEELELEGLRLCETIDVDDDGDEEGRMGGNVRSSVEKNDENYVRNRNITMACVTMACVTMACETSRS